MKQMNKFFSYLWSKMKHNWGLKLLSFLFAIVLWNSAVVEEDPLRPQTFPDIPITVVGAEQLAEKDLALVQSISSIMTSAKVTVNINRSQISSYDESALWVQLDLSRIPSVGSHEVKLISTNANVEKISPETITIEVDERANRVIPVEVEVVGTLPEGYHRGTLSVSPNAIQVSGAKSIVEQIEKAYLRLDLTDRTSTVNIPKEYSFVDSSGTAIDASSLDVSFDSVVVEMPVTPKKEVLIVPSLLGQDKLKDGYEYSGYVVEPDTIEVTGEAELLNGLTSVQLEAIDITGQSENVFTQELNILIPDGITLLGADTASLLVQIQEIMAEKKFEGIDIALRNIPDGLDVVDFDKQLDITVIAPVNVINSIAANHITLYVDLSGAAAGETELTVQFESPEEYRVQNVIVSESTVIVTLR